MSIAAERMSPKSTYIVKGKSSGIRLDLFLRDLLPDQPTRPSIQKLILEGSVAIDGVAVIRPGARLLLGMKITVKGVKPGARQKRASAATLLNDPKVIAETDAFLVLSKPAGIAMHPAGNSSQRTIVDWLSTNYPLIIGVGDDERRPGLVHRLDKDTSGVVLIAKTNRSFKALKKLFQERSIEKTYLALVYGQLHEPSGSIDLPIGRVKGEKKRAVPAGKREFAGVLRDAQTNYALRTRYTDYDLVLVKPKTGRTHQIRVHLAALGHPIVGDRLYRFKEHRQDHLRPPFQLLHAGELSFELGKRKYHYLAPLPQYFSDVLKMLDAEAGRGYDWNA